MPGKAQMGKKAQCMEQSMSILSPFPTLHGAARGFFNSLLTRRGGSQGIVAMKDPAL
jgi:hypothetical protein